MQKITTFLWFDYGKAEEAARFYVSVFKKGSKVNSAGAMGATFTLCGQRFISLNGGPKVKFNPAVSLYVDCKDQREVDTLWEKLLAGGGRPTRCGWLEDKYGLSWQIIPKALPALMGSKDPAKAKRVFDAMMQMVKIDVAGLKAAAKG